MKHVVSLRRKESSTRQRWTCSITERPQETLMQKLKRQTNNYQKGRRHGQIKPKRKRQTESQTETMTLCLHEALKESCVSAAGETKQGSWSLDASARTTKAGPYLHLPPALTHSTNVSSKSLNIYILRANIGLSPQTAFREDVFMLPRPLCPIKKAECEYERAVVLEGVSLMWTQRPTDTQK